MKVRRERNSRKLVKQCFKFGNRTINDNKAMAINQNFLYLLDVENKLLEDFRLWISVTLLKND